MTVSTSDVTADVRRVDISSHACY